MGGKVIVAGVIGLFVGLVGGAVATWGLDPADEPEQSAHGAGGATSFVLFVEPELPDAEVASLETELRGDPRIRGLDYMDPDETRAEYRRIFADDDEMLDRLDENPDLLPTSFRFSVSTADESAIATALHDLGRTDGVSKVIATLETRASLEPGQGIRWNG